MTLLSSGNNRTMSVGSHLIIELKIYIYMYVCVCVCVCVWVGVCVVCVWVGVWAGGYVSNKNINKLLYSFYTFINLLFNVFSS